MGKSLTEIAQQLKDIKKKVQLVYAFNGTGKTRLSREFRLLIDPKDIETGEEPAEDSSVKIVYYNAFTEDLFYWDNDLKFDAEPKLMIQPNSFTKWILSEQGKAPNVIDNFQHYTDKKLTPHFNEEYFTDVKDSKTKVNAFSEVRFSFERGNAGRSDFVKISKGEENNFIWCVFYSLIEQVIAELNIPESENRSTSDFNDLEYIFIDDPVSSLDENNLIELAVNISELIKSSESKKLKFIISTHNPLFYNALYNETGAKSGFFLRRFDDGTFDLEEKKGDSNQCFSYHLHLKKTIETAIDQKQIQRYHFTLLRNLYEKTAQFLGYPKWSELLPDDKQTYLNRIIQFTSHSTLTTETVAEPNEPEKQIVAFLLKHLIDNYSYWQESSVNERL